MIGAKMSNKELAEKVELANKILQKLDLTMAQPYTDEEFIKETFNWPTFGLMVEKAEEMGWKINWVADNISFSKNDGEFLATSQYLTGEKSSDSPIKACALAFLETFEDETHHY